MQQILEQIQLYSTHSKHLYALYQSIISVILHILFIPRRCRYGLRNMVAPLGKQLGVHMRSCYQTPDRALKGTWEHLASL